MSVFGFRGTFIRSDAGRVSDVLIHKRLDTDNILIDRYIVVVSLVDEFTRAFNKKYCYIRCSYNNILVCHGQFQITQRAMERAMYRVYLGY